MSSAPATVFPCGIDEVQLFRYSHLLQGVRPLRAVSPPSWGLQGIDVGAIDGGSPVGVQVASDIEPAIREGGCLLLAAPPSDDTTGMDGDSLLSLLQQNETKTALLFPPRAAHIDFVRGLRESDLLAWCPELPALEQELDSPAHHLSVPSAVLFVVGFGERTGKFEVQLAVRDVLLGQGRRVCQIGSRYYSGLFGMRPFPPEMHERGLHEQEKVQLFRKYLSDSVHSSEAEVLVVGIPGGMFKNTDYVHNNYGITHLLSLLTVTPDAMIVCLYYEEYDPDVLEGLSNTLRSAFGVGRVLFIKSKSWFDYVSTEESKELRVVSLRERPEEYFGRRDGEACISLFDAGYVEALKESLSNLVSSSAKPL